MKPTTESTQPGGIETSLVTSGRDTAAQKGFVNPPVVRGSTVLYPTAEDLHEHRGEFQYGRHGTPTTKALQDPMTNCSMSSTAYLVAAVNPKPTVSRQSFLTHACSDLTTNATTLTYALGRIGGTAPAPTRENVIKLFHLFYRAHPDPQEGLVESLQLMFADGTPVRDSWASAIFTVCASSHWQVL